MISQPIQVYAPINDSDFDVVYATLESGHTFRIGFGENKVTTVNQGRWSMPKIEFWKADYESIGINKKSIVQNKVGGQIEKFNSRFLVISVLFITGTILAGYLTYQTESFVSVVKTSSFGLFFWIMLEYEQLRVKSAYIMLFGISSFLAFWGYHLSFETEHDIWVRSTKMSLIFLILYKILRYFYLLLFNREPDFDRSASLIEDRVYSFLLLIGTVLCSMFI